MSLVLYDTLLVNLCTTEQETDPDKAYESYVCFGDDPWIEGVEFSASEYAKIKIKEVLKG